MRPVFEAALHDEAFEVYLLALPPKIIGKNYDVSHERYGKNEAYPFCRRFYEKAINVYNEENKTWFDIKALMYNNLWS